MEELTK